MMGWHYLVRYEQVGNDELREAGRPQHIAYRKGLGSDLALAGPLLGTDGKPVGSVVIIAAKGLSDAERIAKADPFVTAGLLRLISLEPMRIAAIQPPAPAA